MKKLFLLLLPAFALAQESPYSTYNLVKARVDSIAKAKADSAFAVLQAQVNAAIAHLNASKLNTQDTPTIRFRILPYIQANYTTSTDLNNLLAGKLSPSDTNKLRQDVSVLNTIAASKLTAADTVKLRNDLNSLSAALVGKLSAIDTVKLRQDINANKQLIVARDSIMMLLARVDSVKTRTLFTQTAINTIANTATKMPMVGTGVGSLTIPSGTLTVGKTYRIRIEGVYSTPILLNIANVTCRMELNGTAITTGNATSLLASANNSAFSAEQLITIRSIGTNGTLVAIGGLNFASSLGARAYVDWNTGTGTAPINTTIANTFTPTIQFSNSNNGNSVSSVICTFEALN